MAKDLRILLGADLDLKNINEQIKKLQNTVINLKVNFDSKQFEKQFSGAGNAMGKGMADATKAQMKGVYQQLQAEATKARSILDAEVKRLEQVTNSAANVNVRRGKNGRVSSASITYQDNGKTVKQDYAWVSKEVKEIDKKTGEMATKLKKSFEYIGESVNTNMGKVQSGMDGMLSRVEKLRNNLTSGTTKLFDQNQLQKVVSEYDNITASIQKAKDAGIMWSDKTVTGVEKQILTNQRLTAEYQKQQKELIRQENLGRTQIGNLGGLNLGSSSLEDIKKLYQTQLSGHLKKDVKMENISVDSLSKDNSTGQWVAKLSATVEDGKNKMMRYKSTMDEASNSTRIFGERVLTTANRNLNFLEKLKVAMQSIPIWMVGMTAFYQTLHFFSDGIKFVNDLNKSLTELSIVFNTSQAGVAEYNKTFHDLALNMSMTTEEVAKGAVEFARQGMSQTKMIERMKTASVYAKISGIDFSESAKILTASVNSFDKLGLTAEHAADIFSYMGDATATGADEIGRAMQRVGGTAGSVGLSFEKLASWIAVVSSRTREGSETIGNAFKSIIARYQSIKQKGFDETDGTKINQVTQALASVGIMAVDAKGQLGDFGGIMDQLGTKWTSLDSRQKAYLATTVAGTYQQSRFLNIMEGYPDSIALYEKSLNSAGVAQQKFDRYQEGTEAHLNRLKTAWHGVFQSSFDSNGLQSIIESLTQLALSVDYLVQHVGLLPIVLGGLGTAAVALNGKIRALYISMVPFTSLGGKWGTAYANMGASISRFNASLFQSVVQLRQFQGMSAAAAYSMVALKVAATGVGIAVRAAGIALSTFLPMAAFMALGYVIQLLTEHIQANIEKQKQFDEMVKTVANNITNHKESITKLVDEYKKLDKSTNSGTFGDDKQIQKYYDVSKDLSNLLPNLIDHIDEQGRAHLRNADAIDTELKIAEDLAKMQANKTIGESTKAFQSNRDAYVSSKASAKRAENKYTSYAAQMEHAKNNNYEITPEFAASVAAAQAEMVQKNYLLKASADVATQSFIQLGQALQMQNGVKFGEEMQQQIEKYISTLDFSKKETLANFQSVFSQMVILEKAMKSANGHTDKEKIAMDAFADSVKNIKAGDTKAFLEGLQTALYNSAQKAKNATKEAYDFGVSLKELQSMYSDSAGKLSILNGLLEDNAKGKQVSAEEVMKLIEKDTTMSEVFNVQNGMITLNIAKIEERKRKEIDAYKESGRTRRETLISMKSELYAKLTQFGFEADALDKINKSYDERLQNAKTYSEAIGLSNEKSGILTLKQELDQITKAAELGGAALKTVGESKEGIKSTTEAISQLQAAIDGVNEAIGLSQSTQMKYAKSSQQYRDAVKNEIGLLEKKQELLDKGAKDPSLLMPVKETTSVSASNTIQTSNLANQNLNQSSGDVTAEALNKWIESKAPKDSGMLGQGDAFLKAAQAAGIDPVYLVAHAGHETGWGTSRIYKDKNNLFGIGATDHMPYENAYSYQNPVDGITAGAKWISEHYIKNGQETLQKMRFTPDGKHQYATDENWANKIADTMSGYYGGDNQTVSVSGNGISTEKKYTKKELSDKQTQAGQDSEKISQEKLARYRDLLDSILAETENKSKAWDLIIKESSAKSESMTKISQDYRNELHVQADAMREQQTLLHQQVLDIQASGIQSDDLTQKVNDLSASWWDLNNAISSKSFDWINSKLAEMADHMAQLDYQLSLSKAKADTYVEGSKEQRFELEKQIELLKQKQVEAKKESAFLTEQLNNENLSIAQKKELNNQLQQLTIAELTYAKEAADADKAIKDQKGKNADAIIDLLKDGYKKQKELEVAAIEERAKALDKAHNDEMRKLEDQQKGYELLIQTKIKALDNASDERKHNQEMDKKQKDRQELMNRISILSMDNSSEAKTQLKDLNKQLDAMNKDIENSQYDRKKELEKKKLQDDLDAAKLKNDNNKQAATDKFDLDKEALDKEKTAREKFYDEIINDEKHWADTRKQIIAGNTKDVMAEMDKLKVAIDILAPKMGEAFQKNFIDRIIDAKAKLLELTDASIVIEQMMQNSQKYTTASTDDQKKLAVENKKLADSQGYTKDANGEYVNMDGKPVYTHYVGTPEEMKTIATMKENSQRWLTEVSIRDALALKNQQLANDIGATMVNGEWTKNGLKLYHEGGVIGGSGNKQTKLINSLFNASPNEQVVMALMDELMIPSANITKNFVPNMASVIAKITPNNGGTVNGGNTYQIIIDKVIGDEKGANLVASTVINSIKKRGGKF